MNKGYASLRGQDWIQKARDMIPSLLGRRISGKVEQRYSKIAWINATKQWMDRAWHRDVLLFPFPLRD